MFIVELDQIPDLELAGLRHQGAYNEIGRAFERMEAILSSRNLESKIRGIYGVYYDDPASVAQADLRSHAAVDIQGGMTDGLERVLLQGGRYAILHFKGPYTGLMAAYGYLFGEWLPQSGEEPRDVPCFEHYLNSPMDTAPDELLTDICFAVK